MGVEIDISPLNLRLYRERFVPAYRAAESGVDYGAFADLLRSGLPLAADRLQEPQEEPPRSGPDWNWKATPAVPRHVVEGALEMLESETASSAEKTALVRDIGPYLVDLLCVPWDRLRNPSFNVTRSVLTNELTRQSETLDRMLFGMRLTGGRLEVSLSQSAFVMSRADLERVIAELARIPRPEGGELLAQYDEFRELVEFARTNPEFALVVMSH